MRILGVDPGTQRTGVGIIESSSNRYKLIHFETFTVQDKIPLAERLHRIYQFLLLVIRKYEPGVLALEDVFFDKDVRATVKIGEARACAMIAASEAGVAVVEYPPARVKQAVTGNGRASKEQIQGMVKQLLRLKELPPSDGADAIAVAICHLHSRKNVPIPYRQSG